MKKLVDAIGIITQLLALVAAVNIGYAVVVNGGFFAVGFLPVVAEAGLAVVLAAFLVLWIVGAAVWMSDE